MTTVVGVSQEQTRPPTPSLPRITGSNFTAAQLPWIALELEVQQLLVSYAHYFYSAVLEKASKSLKIRAAYLRVGSSSGSNSCSAGRWSADQSTSGTLDSAFRYVSVAS